jgi:hypothetical protein
MVGMAKTGMTTTQGLRSAIERSGYYPTLVAEAVESAVGSDSVEAFLVHQETTFDANEVRRHVTVLVLTGTRFIVSHIDEQGADDTSPVPYATTSTESVTIGRISSVVVSRVVANPEQYTRGTLPREVVLTIGWGAVSRIDLEPAACVAAGERGGRRPGDGGPGPRVRAGSVGGDGPRGRVRAAAPVPPPVAARPAAIAVAARTEKA